MVKDTTEVDAAIELNAEFGSLKEAVLKMREMKRKLEEKR